MFSNDRSELRKVFFDCWQLKLAGKPLDALQQMIVSIIEQHPEYHALFEKESNIDRDYDISSGETNPFMHMSMHIALAEQISTDRPTGIRAVHQQLSMAFGSAHEAEHKMMDCLSEALWQAQQNNTMPNETAYLNCLQTLTSKS